MNLFKSLFHSRDKPKKWKSLQLFLRQYYQWQALSSASRPLDDLTELKDDSKTWRHLLISVLYRPRSLQYWPSSASLRANVSITMRSLSSLFHLRSLKLLPLFGMTWPSFRARDTQL